MPPGGWQAKLRYSDLLVKGRPPAPTGVGGWVAWRSVTPEYFRALDIPVIRGRGFTNQDGKSDVPLVVLSRLAAARLFPGEDPTGKYSVRGPGGAWFTVAGVADDAKNGGLTSDEEPEIYYLRKDVADDWQDRPAVLVIRSVLPEATLAGFLQGAVHNLDPTVPAELEPLTETVNRLADRPRFETALLGFFALLGLAMAAVGIYGILAYLTSQRTQEIGVRMALGATHANILGLIARDGLRMVLAGGAVGLAAALGLAHVLRALLYQTSTYDTLAFVVVPVVLCVVAGAAILLPARVCVSRVHLLRCDRDGPPVLPEHGASGTRTWLGAEFQPPSLLSGWHPSNGPRSHYDFDWCTKGAPICRCRQCIDHVKRPTRVVWVLSIK